MVAASFDALVITFTTPGGNPAARIDSPIRRCVVGHSSDAFKITQLPQASGVAIARTENDRRILRRNAQHDTRWLANGDGE